MKKTLLLLLTAWGLPLFAAPAVAEVCAHSPQDVAASPVLKSTLQSFGGASNLFGTWDLAGLASIFAKVSVTLTASRNSFSVQVEGGEVDEFWLCVDSAEPDVFKMRVQHAYDPANALILIKAREPGATVMVAAQKTNWKFMKFKRH